jgi:hypothetical protein
MRAPRAYPFEDLLVAVFPPGFLLSVLWTVMYEIYNEEGSFYTSLIQEIIGTEGLFPYFVVLAVLMAFPVGMVIDGLRQMLSERRLLRRTADRGRDGVPSPLDWMVPHGILPSGFADRYALYRHARATLLVPARAAGNLALVLLIAIIWFIVKVIRMRGWQTFSWLFLIGTPVVGLGIVWLLRRHHAAGIQEFHQLLGRFLGDTSPPSAPPVVPETTPEPSAPTA